MSLLILSLFQCRGHLLIWGFYISILHPGLYCTQKGSFLSLCVIFDVVLVFSVCQATHF